ncbi:hypothetical protein DPMN_067979 [Dreissena polymorpha]|uniref:Uncharacterized protein n=1 Tax=Dreissena polymorpha TaxID=45954 RepID=A0A9D4BLT1_DREPO|nr:hypothetical protein DPMN_067979 [Dreissena polymorpha]
MPDSIGYVTRSVIVVKVSFVMRNGSNASSLCICTTWLGATLSTNEATKLWMTIAVSVAPDQTARLHIASDHFRMTWIVSVVCIHTFSPQAPGGCEWKWLLDKTLNTSH